MAGRTSDGSLPADGPSPDRALSIGSEDVWRAIAKASFAVVSHVTPGGEPRSSGVVYAVAQRRLWFVVAADCWKARQIATGKEVVVTVPVRRGGLLSLAMPIPPATISFHATALVHSAGSLDVASLPKQLRRLMPDEGQGPSVIELRPEGRFVTYGIGVRLLDMRHPELSRARVPVG
jgi:hypothetical protein